MISQKCPKCLSSRVRRGYRPTPFWSKLLFRYNLLCDNCNWEFTGFAVPGTVTAKPTKNPKKKQTPKATNTTTINSKISEDDLHQAGAETDFSSENSDRNGNGIEAAVSESANQSFNEGNHQAKRGSGV